MTDTTTQHSSTAGTWKLDPTYSEVTFSVKHLAISKVRGSFRTFDVTVVVGEDPKDTTVSAPVDVASVDTNQADRDNHLRTSDFFLVEEYPTMTFLSTGITMDGEDFTIDGDLTLRGVTKPVTLKVEIGGVAADSYGQTKAGVAATAKINRKDFGVNWNAALEGGGFTLGDEVSINVELQLVLQK